MCSNNCDENNEMPQPIDNLMPLISDTCRKCAKDGSTIILRNKDLYCNSCFLVYFIHKFRSTIGKARQIKPGDKILIPFLADLNSTALLHLIRQGLDEDSHKKLRFEPTFLHIDGLLDVHESAPPNIICREIDKLKFPCYYIRIQDVMKDDAINPIKYSEEIPVGGNSSTDNEFQRLLSAIKCKTDKEDYIFHLAIKLICICAHKLNFTKVFLADNSADISIRILTHVALGRGSQLPDHVGFKSTYDGISIFRPMRELLQDEVEHFVRVNNIKILSEPKKCLNASSNSIQSCTEDFLHGLQKEFRATVPTVLKIGLKVEAVNCDGESSSVVNARREESNSIEESTNENSSRTSIECLRDDSICVLCGYTIDTERGNTSAHFSQVVSEKLSLNVPPILKNNIEEVQNLASLNLDDGLSLHLCYGCRHLMKNLPSTDILPESTRRRIEECSRVELLRKTIEDFIL